MTPTHQYTNTPIHQNDIVILFDLDGTLIDSTEAILESFRESFSVLGGDCPGEEEIKALIGHPLEEMYRRLGAGEERTQEYVRTYKETYRRIHTEKTVLLPGAAEAIRHAACFARLGVVTTKTGRYSRELLEYFGVMHHFEVLIGSEDVKRHKPHPEPIRKALELMGGVPQRCWMIGDTCLDMRSAAAAGIGGIAVTCGYGSRGELAACTDKIEENVRDALTRIFPQ